MSQKNYRQVQKIQLLCHNEDIKLFSEDTRSELGSEIVKMNFENSINDIIYILICTQYSKNLRIKVLSTNGIK